MQNIRMTEFEKAYQEVAGLVHEFDQNKDQYVSSKYQESQVRTDFIDKFFLALGWDVRHIEQTNPREQEVQIENNSDSISNRKVDYAFFLAPDFQRPVFLVEAKKPSVILKSKDFYFQTVRYGFMRGTTVTVLTDFKEFHILDCRRKPQKVDNIVPETQLKTFTYTDYIDKQKFGYIYWLFSKEAVFTGKLKEYWKSLPKPKGKSRQLKLIGDTLQAPDDIFLEDLDEYRRVLASEFKKANPELTGEDLTEAAQKTLDRLVFLRFLEDKMIEPDFVVDTFGVKGSAWKRFISASERFDKKYNGIVFKKHFIDGVDFINPNDDKFYQICEEFNHQNSPYLFSYIPVEILGSIYERFLGKVVVANRRGISIEKKVEVPKAGGVYYTPKYVVDYLVSNTVGKVLAGKTPKEIEKLRFGDIACGSGSFLIAVFGSILEYMEDWYNNHPNDAKKDKCRPIGGSRWALSLAQKRNVLVQNIYGVDIDSQAVEVAQLSLFLKLLEAESISTTQDSFFRDHTILPDLSKNIVCGNSLVDFDIADLFPLSSDKELQVKPFSFQSSFSKIMSSGGFDAIVGNPPYVRIQVMKELRPDEVKYLSSKYKTASKGNYDMYVVFVEKALDLLKQKGLFGYILPSKFLRQIMALICVR
jgi:adenine-specific DNA-methyltransferase